MSKNTLKLLAIALISFAVIFLSVASVPDGEFNKIQALLSVVKFDSEFRNSTPLSLYNFNKLNSAEKQAYISIYNSINKHPEYIKIPDLTNEEFKNVYFAVKNDNPDVLCFPDSCDMVSFYNASFVHMEFKTTVDECNIMTDKLLAETDRISALCTFTSEYDKELFFHDYLINNCTYNENALFGSDAYGCIINREAYCSGYSRAMMLLLINNGIECILVSGNAVSDNEIQSHMWNVVTINGSNYHLDVTWDDHEQNDNIAAHMYFNVTTEQLSLTHTDISVDIPCTADEYNYFRYEGLLYDVFDNQVCRNLGSKLSENISEGKYYIEFRVTDTDIYDNAFDMLFNRNASHSSFYLIIDSIDPAVRNSIDSSHINTVTDRDQKYIRLMFDKK